MAVGNVKVLLGTSKISHCVSVGEPFTHVKVAELVVILGVKTLGAVGLGQDGGVVNAFGPATKLFPFVAPQSFIT